MTVALTPPDDSDACLMLADGTVFFGNSIGAANISIGELCFNTAMTGYQEIMTDPSYAGQIVVFTFPHIGNVGANAEDFETVIPVAAGLVVREKITAASNYRSQSDFNAWLKEKNISGICGVDTRALTRHIRTKGAQNAVIFGLHVSDVESQLKKMTEHLNNAPSMKGAELAAKVTTGQRYSWDKNVWNLSPEPPLATKGHTYHVVAIDYGAKHNILRSLVQAGCRVTVVPAKTSADEILALEPDGIFLSNGPGDPAATGIYALPVINALIKSGLPIFGICLGHQLLGLALGAKTEKMAQGHRGANHPVKDLTTGKVEITSQNHGFVVARDELPKTLEITHISLFDGTIQGIRAKDKPIFGVQGHPEASPGPHDSKYLFERFVALMKEQDSGARIQGKKIP